jgi:hypothetical protein
VFLGVKKMIARRWMAIFFAVSLLAACPKKQDPETTTPAPSSTSASASMSTEPVVPVRRWIKVPSVEVRSESGVAGRLPGGITVNVVIDGDRGTLVGERLAGTVPLSALSETKVTAASRPLCRDRRRLSLHWPRLRSVCHRCRE